MKVLIIGYGNPGRLDDGLGPALAEHFQCLEGNQGAGSACFQGLEESVPVAARDFQGLEKLTIESNYQLNVEDAAQIAEFDVVVFADASTDAEPPFTFESVIPEEGGLTFSSHSVSAPQLMGMVKDLFHAEPKAYMLAIRGYDFNEFGEQLSEQATQNLEDAIEFLKQWFKGKLI